MKTNRLLPILGLCKKAGRLKYGFDSVKEALRKEANLLVFASDTSEKQKAESKDLQPSRISGQFALRFHVGAGTPSDWENTAIAAICDKGLAELFLRRIEES